MDLKFAMHIAKTKDNRALRYNLHKKWQNTFLNIFSWDFYALRWF